MRCDEMLRDEMQDGEMREVSPNRLRSNGLNPCTIGIPNGTLFTSADPLT